MDPYLRVDFFRAPLFFRVEAFFRVDVFLRAPVVFFLRAAISDSGPSAGDQIEYDQHQNDEQEDVDQTAADVHHEETNKPKQEQNDDDRPEQAYHVFSFIGVSIGTLFPQSGPTNAFPGKSAVTRSKSGKTLQGLLGQPG
ncbi:MAG: hypothetical protein WCE97_05645 [Candidatus Cybelea sp.]